QFAILGLWAARRHGLPVEGPMALVNARFRSSQGDDGGWGYRYAARPHDPRHKSTSTATMTCAGLIGLAAVHEVTREVILRTERPKVEDGLPQLPEPSRDDAIRKGLLALSTVVGAPLKQRGPGAEVPILQDTNLTFYFLWSLERVMVAYGLPTV